MKKYLAEFLGTVFTVLLACGSAVLAGPSIGVLGIGLCFGLVLLALCYTIGGISGCRINPAVSLGVYLTDKSFFCPRPVRIRRGTSFSAQLSGLRFCGGLWTSGCSVPESTNSAA